MISKKGSKSLNVLGRVILFYLLSIVIFATISGLTKKLNFADHLSISITSVLTLFLVILFAKWEKLKSSQIGLKVKNTSIPRFLSGFVIGISMVLIQVLIVSNFAEVKFSLSSNYSFLNIISALFLYCVIAFREELVFRSYSLRSLAYSINPLLALTILTAIFILEHVIAGVPLKMAIIGSGFGGILFGLAALKTKGLALPLGLHFAWNFAQWLFGFKNNTGVWREIVKKGHESNAENIALTGFVIAMIIGITSVLLFYKKEKI